MSEDTGSWAEYQKLVLRLLEQHDEKLELLQQKIENAIADRFTFSSAIAEVKEQITTLREEVSLLRVYIKESQAIEPSINDRLTRLEFSNEKFESYLQETKEEKDFKRRNKFALVLALLGSTTSIILTIVNLVLR